MPPMPAATVAERLPRFERRPRSIRDFEMTERAEEILKMIARHRFITSDQIVGLLQAMFPGSSEQKILRLLYLLFHSGYVARPKAQVDAYKAGGGARKITYAIGNKGIDHLATHFGFRRASVDWTAKSRTAVRGEIDHSLEVTEFMVALDIACRKRGTLQLIHFDEILASIAPEETRQAKRPYQWPVSLRWKGREVILHPTPDAIFGIRDLERHEGANRKFFFLGGRPRDHADHAPDARQDEYAPEACRLQRDVPARDSHEAL